MTLVKENGTANGNGTTNGQGTGRRVLLVDDTADIRLMLRLQLQTAGVDFQEASSGEEALTLCGRDPFDLVLLDYRMPGLTGVEVAKKLRAVGYGAPIVIYSAYVNMALEADARQLDVPVIDKADQKTLRETVASVVS
jgi:CheY-like chemotaxis protein